MRGEVKDSTLSELILWLMRLRRRVRVTGASMLPVLQPGEEILFDPYAYRRASPQPGDIVVALHPFQRQVRLVKRITQQLEDGRFYLNGDNPAESTDSRSFGPVTLNQILGRVTSRFA